VGEEAAAGLRPRLEAAVGENDLVANGVGEGVDRRRRVGGPPVGVDPHTREVVAEPARHLAADVIGQG
jgi:hypothetical protein